MKICEILLFGVEKSRVVRFDPPVQKWGMNSPCNKGLREKNINGPFLDTKIDFAINNCKYHLEFEKKSFIHKFQF